MEKYTKQVNESNLGNIQWLITSLLMEVYMLPMKNCQEKKKLNLNLTKDLDPITNIQEIQRTKEHVIR